MDTNPSILSFLIENKISFLSWLDILSDQYVVNRNCLIHPLGNYYINNWTAYTSEVSSFRHTIHHN